MIVIRKRSVDRKKQVADLFHAGCTDAEIIEKTGLSQQAVYGHRSEMGLLRTKSPKRPDVEVPSNPKEAASDLCIRLHNDGFSNYAISRKTGLTMDTVETHLAELLIARGPKPIGGVGALTLMEKAEQALLGRLVYKPDGWYLDGRLSRLEEIIPEANRVNKAWGLPEIGPDKWRAP